MKEVEYQNQIEALHERTEQLRVSFQKAEQYVVEHCDALLRAYKKMEKRHGRRLMLDEMAELIPYNFPDDINVRQAVYHITHIITERENRPTGLDQFIK